MLEASNEWTKLGIKLDLIFLVFKELVGIEIVTGWPWGTNELEVLIFWYLILLKDIFNPDGVIQTIGRSSLSRIDNILSKYSLRALSEGKPLIKLL